MSSPKHPAGSGLFRERAVSSIDSVERFDEAITIVSSRSVLALATICALLFCVMIWAIFGTVSVGVQGRGVIVSGSGVQLVIAASAGTLIALPQRVGDIVAQGEAIARMRTSGGDIVALRAPATGRLAERSPQLGSFIAAGDPVATIEPAGASPTAIVFVPVETDRQVAVGMTVRLARGRPP